MKRILKLFLCCLVAFLIYSCGGTHGSIEGYDFDISEEELKVDMDKLVDEHSELSYQEHEMGSKYFSLLIKEDIDYIFVYRFYGGEEEQKKPGSRVFIAYVKIGDGKFLTTKNISSSDEEKILRIFEERFINELK